MNPKDIVHDPDNVRRLTDDAVIELISKASMTLEREPSLIRLDVDEAFFVGDTHGDFRSTVNVTKMFLESEGVHLIFLGDYVDRGPEQIENINYLLALKSAFPHKVTLLRGNHESPQPNFQYGFLTEVRRRFPADMYQRYSECFSLMPYGALVKENILVLHGGIAEGLTSLSGIEALPKGDVDPKNPVAFQILWNDPGEEATGFQPSMRGSGIRVFGRDVFERFARENRVDMLIRAHEYFQEGFHRYFNGKILSLFTCRYYPNTQPKIAAYRRGELELLSVR